MLTQLATRAVIRLVPVLAGVSLGGDTFFYPNPLESDGRYAFNQKALTRKPWFDSSCCPTNVARFIPSVPDYVYAVRGDTLYVNLYVASEARVDVGGAVATFAQKTAYPWDGRIELRIDPGGRPRPLDPRVMSYLSGSLVKPGAS